MQENSARKDTKSETTLTKPDTLDQASGEYPLYGLRVLPVRPVPTVISKPPN